MSTCVFLGLFAVYLHQVAGSVTNNGIPYDRMPKLTAVDAYAPCLQARGDIYCFVSARLCGDSTHSLYNALLEHSANNFTHYDRTNVHRGICLKNTCQQFLNISPNVTVSIEACLNYTLSRDYGLKARVFKSLCSEYQERVQFDASDYAYGAVVFFLIGLNLLGSFYDFCGSRENTIVGRSLLSFSVRRNWQKLMATQSSDSGKSQLLGLSWHRVILSFAIVWAHTACSALHAIENTEFVEEAYNNPILMVSYTGMDMLQITFIMSALLLANSVLKSEENATWRNLHKPLLQRWLRFTPTYGFMLFFTSTWARHVGEGPFWKTTVEMEANDCRRDWWAHILYIDNYVDNSLCMLHSWSMAVDMQLTVLGVAIFFLLKSERARKVAIALLLPVGVAATAASIYFNNLNTILISSPEVLRNWIVHDPTFNYLYKRGHTNLICYGLGLALGYVVHNLKKTDLGAEKYKKFRVVHWLLIPGFFAAQLIGSVFYGPGPVPLPVRLFYSSIMKLISGLLFCAQIFLTIVKTKGVLLTINAVPLGADYDNFQIKDSGLRTNKIFKCRVWTPLARLTFCVYILHFSVIRMRVAAQDTPLHVSYYMLGRTNIENFIASYLLAVPLFLLVEAPCGELTKLFFSPRHQKKRVD